MSIDQHKHLRFELPVNVKLTTKNGNEIILKSQNISDGGIFLSSDSVDLPKVGETVVIQLESRVAGDEPNSLNAIVVRANNNGIGIEFLVDDEE